MNFSELVNANKQNVKNIIKMITKQENEDLEQEVYIRAWKNSDKYKEQGAFKSWLNTIAKNIAKDYLKSAFFKQSQNSTSDEFTLNSVQDTKTTPETKSLYSERQKHIINAIEELKPKLKEVIILSEIYDYTYEEISKKIHCPVGTVKSRIFNAKKELAEKLKDLIEV